MAEVSLFLGWGQNWGGGPLWTAVLLKELNTRSHGGHKPHGTRPVSLRLGKCQYLTLICFESWPWVFSLLTHPPLNLLFSAREQDLCISSYAKVEQIQRILSTTNPFGWQKWLLKWPGHGEKEAWDISHLTRAMVCITSVLMTKAN